jgi:hypothetical protein
MPQCAVGDKCICPNAPLEGGHFCAICKKPLHGPCGVFNGDDSSITYRNHCFNCSSATAVASSTSKKKVGPNTPCTTPFATQQSTLVTAKDIDYCKPGSMVKSVLIICGINAMQFNTEKL